jgi:serine/threonine protein kinase
MPYDHSFVIGERIPGTKYVLCGLLGKGGMGTVYEVVKEPGIRGAMKVMHPSMVTRPDCVARFFDEVRLLAKLRHKNIVAVYDFDTLGDGTPYLVMEKLEGETLRSTLRKSARSKQGFPARGAYEVIRQTCEGLYRAHTRSSPVVHRDIKPENLFLNQLPGSDEVEVKVLDFGVAALVDSNGARGQFGTPKYMAPEQFRGEPATPSSDLYAVALVLYEMVTGRLPWDAETDVDVCRAHMSLDPVPPSRFAPWVPESIDALILRGLARDPAQRLHSVFAFASQLYELQWVDDGHTRAQDVNTTAPTLPALVAAFEEDHVELAGGSGHDTFRGMTPPPIEGASLEIIPYDDTVMPRETIQVESPRFSPATIARAMAGPTKVPASKPSVDRLAPTPEMLPLTRPVPKYDTEPIADPSPLSPPSSREQSSPRLPVPPAQPASTPLAGTVGSTASRAPKSMDRALQLVPYAVFFAIVAVGTTMSAMATRGLATPAATAQRVDVSSALARMPEPVATQVSVVPEVRSTLTAPAAVNGVQLGVDASAGPAQPPHKARHPLVATAPQAATTRDAGRAPEPFLEWGQEP